MNLFPNWQAWLDLLATRRDAPVLYIALVALVVVVWLHNAKSYPRPMVLMRVAVFVLFIIGIVIPLVNQL